MRRVVWILLVLASLAGCAETSSEPEAEEFLAATPTATTGAISGVVVDATINPIAGATVTMKTTGQETVTDDGGRFTFDDLAPGLYAMDVAAPRYFAVQQVADVVAGEVSSLRIMLEADLTPEPFHETFSFKGQIVFHATVAWAQLEWMLDTYAGISTPACECVFTFEGSGTPQGHVFEAVWVDNIQDPRGPNSNYWSYAVPEPYQELFGYAVSPIYQTWDEAPFEETGEYKVMLLGDADMVEIQQDFEIFLTHWYNAPVPDGWSIVQDTA